MGMLPLLVAIGWFAFALDAAAMRWIDTQFCINAFKRMVRARDMSLRSLVAERQTCNLKVLGSIPSEGFLVFCFPQSAST